MLLNPNVFDNFKDMLSYAGVPLFFMVNGALLFNSQFDLKKHIKKTISLIIVLLILGIISLLVFFRIYKFNYSIINITDLCSYLLGNYKFSIPTGHFWFIIALVSLYIIFPLLKICYDSTYSKPIMSFIIISILILHFIPSDLVTLQFYLSHSLKIPNVDIAILSDYSPFGKYGYVIVYFLLGGILHDY